MQAAQLTNDGSPWVDYDLQQNLSQSVTPDARDDFYLYVNHDWLTNAKIPEGMSSANSFQEIEDETVKNAKAILEDKTLKGHDAKLIQTLNDEFLNWTARDKAGIKLLKPTVKAIKKISSMKELSDFICNFGDLTYGVPTFINLGNASGISDSSSYVTYVSGDGLILGDAAEYTKRTELGDRYYKAYRKEAVTMLKRLGYSSKEAGKMFDRVITFEGKLAKVSYTSDDMMNPDYIQKINNIMKKDKTEKLMKNFPLKRYLKASGYGNSKQYCIQNPAYLKQLDKLYTKKNLNVIKEYMLVHYVLEMTSMLDRKAFDLNIQTANAINGSSGKLSDKEYAYYTVSSMLSVPMQKVYLKKYNASEKKEKITQICQKVIDNYRQMLSKATWLSEPTRQKAVEKLDAIKINAVYPEQWEDYSKLKLDGKSYFECSKAIVYYEVKKNQACANQKVDKNQWLMNTLESNAYYDKIVAFNGQPVSGANVQGEAIADITAMQCILGIAEADSNFDYDKFFKQYAKLWKRVNTPELEYLCLMQDTHPLHYLRTNVTVQQFDEFYDTYQVQKGDKMYLAPEDRITVW